MASLTKAYFTLFTLIGGFFYVFCISLKIFYKKSYSTLSESINEEPDSVIQSIEDISKEELESMKKKISEASKTNYETYIKQFWVGLLEGDGTITVSSPGANHVKVCMFISLKNLKENVIMLLLIQEVIGGTVRIERNGQYVTWVAIRKDLIQFLIRLLKEFPLLTSRKQCQLEFATKCIENGTKDFVVENRDLMYHNQMDIINHNNNNFTLPDYFPAWLSGFVEAEGNFRFLKDKRRNMEISGRFNIGQNFDFYLISAIRDYFGGKVKIQIIVSKNNFSEKRKLLGEVKHYWVEMGSKEVKNSLFAHFSKYPLLGHKNVTYLRWYSSLQRCNVNFSFKGDS